MKKMFLLIPMLLIIGILLNAQTPDLLWSQNDWSGGAGQLSMTDSTMFNAYEALIYGTSLSLDYPDDNTWNLLSTYPTGYAVSRVNKILYTNNTVFVAGGLSGIVSYSTNNGTNWTNMDTLPVNQSEVEVLNIKYIDNVFYAVGYYGGLNMGIVYKSYDLQTWDTTTIQPSSFADRIYDIMQVEGDTFLAVAGNPTATTNMDGMILYSYDACSTWARVDTVAYAVAVKIEKINDTTFVIAKDGYLDGSVLTISYDKGISWSLLTNPDTMYIATALKYNLNNKKMYVGNDIGMIMQSDEDSNFGNWTYLDTLNTIADASLITDIQFIDTVMYVTIDYPGALYRSYDYGYTFELVDSFADDHCGSFAQFGEHTYAVGTGDNSNGGKIYTASYYSNGYIESSVFTMPTSVLNNLESQKIATEIYKPIPTFFTTVKLKVRNSDNADMTGATDWASCDAITLAGNDTTIVGDLSNIVADTNYIYFQYRFELSTIKLEYSPEVNSIEWLDYSGIDEKISNNIFFNMDNSKNILNITNLSNDIYKFSIYNIIGSKVKSGTVLNGLNTFNINMPSGKYILNIQGNNINISKDIFIIK